MGLIRYAAVPAIKDKMVGYQTTVLIHCNQMAKKAVLAPKACSVQMKMPLCSPKVEDNVADTNATGSKNTKVENTKKKINCSPNSAVAGILRMLSIAMVINITNPNRDSVLDFFNMVSTLPN